MKKIDPTTEEKKAGSRNALQEAIREMYPLDEEFRLINLGINDPTNPEYLEYRAAIDALLTNYRNTVAENE